MSANTHQRRACIVFCVILFICLILTIRIYDISMYGTQAKEVLSGQYTRKVTVAEHSGFVYSSDGGLLSHQENGAVAIVNVFHESDKNKAVAYLTDYSHVSADEIISRINKKTPFTVTLTKIPEENAPHGIHVYPLYIENTGALCRHFLGYKNADGQGVDGVLSKFNSMLSRPSGTLSYKYLANAKGVFMDSDLLVIENKEYTDKSGIVLTINREIQKEVDEICDNYMDMGAVVVSHIESGDILAISSRPLYDAQNVAESLLLDTGNLINRAFSLFTPGSVYKTIVAAAALEFDNKLAGFEYECTGEISVSNKVFKCHKKDGHGVLDLESAYANSCNTYFIKLVQTVGFEIVCDMAEKMGLGQIYTIDGFYVKGAKTPSSQKEYPDAYKANASIGQGDILVSPLDILRVFSVCSSGYKRDVSLVKGLCSEDGELTVSFNKDTRAERLLSDETVKKLLSMMKKCVTDGTGSLAKTEKVSVGGKTATAQTGQYKNGVELLHKWFAGVFPIEDPKISVVVLCDGNGENNMSATKIFSMIAEKTAEIVLE